MMDTLKQQTPPGYNVGGYLSNNDATIAEKRWESDAIVYELVKALGGYIPRETADGTIQLVKLNESIPPLVNETGIQALTGVIKGMVNPVIVLSNWTEDEFSNLTEETLNDLAEHVVLNQEAYEIDPDNLDAVYNIIRALIMAEFARARNGHESRNVRTQTVEHQAHSFTENKTSGGWSFGNKNKGVPNG